MEIPDFDVFLSYNSKDVDLVHELATRIRQTRIVPWMAAEDIAPGANWGAVLEEAFARGKSCAICIGPHGLSQWQKMESQAAVDRSNKDEPYRVIPVLLPGSDEHAAQLPWTIRGFQRVDLRGGLDDEDALHAFMNTFQRAAPLAAESRGAACAPENGNASVPRSHDMSGATAMIAAPVSRLSENTHILQQYVKDMTFTPIIGYGCSLVGRSRGAAWRRIAEEMRSLLSYLPTDDPAAAYIRQLAATPVYEVPLGKKSVPPASGEPDRPLIRLQLVLAEIGAKLGAIFANAMASSVTPVWDTPTYRLAIPADHPMLPDVAEALIRASAIACELKAAPDARDPVGLEAHGLYERLIDLAADLTPGRQIEDIAGNSPSDGQPTLGRVYRDIEASLRRRNLREDSAPGEVELALYHLEWIADAIWHTFRYDKAAYPRADELAFQISLLASSARGRRPELASAAEVGRMMLEPPTVAAWFRRYSESPSEALKEFYDSLARILHAEFEAYHEFQRASRRVGGQPDGLRAIQAVAFSANYDLEVEAAFRRVAAQSPFHVVIPVNAYRDRETEPELQWLLGTHYGGPVEYIRRWEWFPRDRILQSREIEGPILIKLHGSPMHELPDDIPDDDALPEYVRLEHALILSERQYMDNIVWKDPLPDFFGTILLQTERSFFFLGQSLNQWGTRLRIYSHVLRRDNPPSRGNRIAIGRSVNPYRSAVLGAIGIQRWIGELEEIPDIVDSVLD